MSPIIWLQGYHSECPPPRFLSNCLAFLCIRMALTLFVTIHLPGRCESGCYWTHCWRVVPCSVYRIVFTLEADISSIWCEDDVTYLLCVWRFLRDNNCQSSSSLINDLLKCTCNYCVDGSIWRFEFPKVVLARTSGEVGTLYTVLLSVDSGTPLPIFIQICSYLADMEQEISWHFFIETLYVYI